MLLSEDPLDEEEEALMQVVQKAADDVAGAFRKHFVRLQTLAAGLKEQRKDLEAKYQAFEEERAAFEEEKRSMQAQYCRPDDVIGINMGGEKTIQVKRALLTQHDGTFLASMFSGRWEETIARDQQGNAFFDDAPDVMMPLIEWLRAQRDVLPGHTVAPPLPNPKYHSAFENVVHRLGYDSLLQCPTSVAQWDYEGHPDKSQLDRGDDGSTVTFRGPSDVITVVAKEPIWSGVHYFEFKMHLIGDEVWVGVANERLMGTHIKPRQHPNMYTYYCGLRGARGSLSRGIASLHAGGEAEVKFDHVMSSDVVGLLLHKGADRVSFFRNGVYQGGCKVPSEPLWLVVALDVEDDCVQVTRKTVSQQLLLAAGHVLQQ